jgi:hypothetical protein
MAARAVLSLASLVLSCCLRPDGESVYGAQVIGWTSNYQETLRELGLEDEDVLFPQGPDRGYTVLVEKYIHRITSTLRTWFVNILEVSVALSMEPKPYVASMPQQLPQPAPVILSSRFHFIPLFLHGRFKLHPAYRCQQGLGCCL